MESLLTGYCFLAALTENQNDLYNQVYVPVCKRALSIYSAQGRNYGASTDIKTIIHEEYGIDVPIKVVEKLLRAVANAMSKRERANAQFNLLDNGSNFQIGKYAFSDFEKQYKRSERNALAIQNAFKAFLESEDIVVDETSTFNEFLSKNKRRIAAFFSGAVDINGFPLDKTYLPHVEFLNHIAASNRPLYEVAESLYVGSLVASYLEAGFDFEPNFQTGETYYLDTPFVLRALDLQKEEETLPARELIKLIEGTGGQCVVLSITIDEIQGILEKAIQHYDGKNPTSSINESCKRRGSNKSWLIGLNADLENRIVSELKVKIETVSNAFKERCVKSADLDKLKKERTRAGTAEHDVFAYLYVRDKRSGIVQAYQKAKYWFLTTNQSLLKFNRANAPYTGITEIVLPEALTSLLWLKNPVKLVGKVKEVGLSELMAHTISEEVASKELIAEFQSTISQIEGISHEDYHLLLASVAHESAKNIDRFIDNSINDATKAAIEAQRLVEKERSRRSKDQQRLRDAQKNEGDANARMLQLEGKLKGFEKIITDLSQAKSGKEDELSGSLTQIEKLQAEIQKQRRLMRRVIFWAIVTVAAVLAFFLLKPHWDELMVWAKWGLNVLIASSGLWGFLSLSINAYKLFKGK